MAENVPSMDELDAFQLAVAAVERAKPDTVILPPAPVAYVADGYGVQLLGSQPTNQTALTQIQGGSLGLKASVPNFLSKKARHQLFWLSIAGGLLALLSSLAIVFLALDTNAVVWVWPSIFSIVLSGLLFMLAYLTVMGFGKVDIDAGFGAAGTKADAEAPSVTEVKPAKDSTDVAPTVVVEAYFSVEMDEASVKEAMSLNKGATPVDATIDYADKVVKLKPKESLDAGGLYTAKLAKSAKSSDGKTLDDDFTWSFTVKK